MVKVFENRINKIDEDNFSLLFHQLYVPLCRFCLKFVRKPEIAEEIVQEQFISLWEKRNEIEIKSSVKAYIYVSVKNKAIDYLRSKYARQNFVAEELSVNLSDNSNPQSNYEEIELYELVTKAVETLPQQCYTIFAMKRFGDYTNKQIAEKLNISEKTVENQVSIAIKKLRNILSKSIFLSCLFFLS